MNLRVLQKKSALDFDQADWQQWAAEHGLPSYLAKQVYCWIFQKGTLDPEAFTNTAKKIRTQLTQEFFWHLPQIHTHMISKDQSEKFLLATKEGLLFEMVLMPYENRVTLCMSSQVGCKRGCTFCQTGKMGFHRNLSSGEILAQILIANSHLQKRNLRVTNVVFMGMGEPLDNYEEVVKACRILIDPQALGLTKSRVTISTAGVVPMIKRLADELPVRLAISLHQADEKKRSMIMPINRSYSLQELKKSLLRYPASQRYGITFEYVMIENENDSIEDAKNLVAFLHGMKAKVNLIPVNHFPGMPMKASTQVRLETFQKYLSRRSIPAPIRYSRGQDISGGCGQLAAKKEEELRLDPRILHRKRRKEQRENNSSRYPPASLPVLSQS
jgi:23S rRNA (adenine2503-C2)-methyltransferase